MTTLTYTIVVNLPTDEFARGALVAKCAPLQDRLATMLQEADIEGTVTHSFDGRKARAPKAIPVLDITGAPVTPAGSYQMPNGGAARGTE